MITTTIVALIALYVGIRIGKVKAYNKSIRIIDTLIIALSEAKGIDLPTFDDFIQNRDYWQAKAGLRPTINNSPKQNWGHK